MRRGYNKKVDKVPTRAVDMLAIAKEIVSLMTSPLTDRYGQMRVYKLEELLCMLDDKYYKVVNKYIDRKMSEYYEPNEDGYSHYDFDQAILRSI